MTHQNVPAARLHSRSARYKSKLRDVGYRPVYEVQDGVLTVLVLAVGRGDRDEVYRAAARR